MYELLPKQSDHSFVTHQRKERPIIPNLIRVVRVARHGPQSCKDLRHHHDMADDVENRDRNADYRKRAVPSEGYDLELHVNDGHDDRSKRA